MIYFVVYGTPTRQYYRGADALAYLDSSAAKHALLRSVSPLRSEADGKTPNLTVTLDNSSGKMSELLATPPIGSRAELVEVDGGVAITLFEGAVTHVSLNNLTAQIEVLS